IKVPSSVDLIRLSEGLSAMESGTDLKREARLLESHPPAISGISDVPAILSEPSIILGEGDSITLWYLPRALAKPIQNHIVSSLFPLHEKLRRSITNQSWRNSEQYFRQGGTPSGCLEFSPARHMQGHSTWKHTPSVSAGLSTSEGKDWAKNICLPSALLSGALSIMHPPLYAAGLQVREKLDAWSRENSPAMQDALEHWSTVYTNLSMMSNQQTPLHRDPQSQSDWYDLLATVGKYDNCFLHIPTLRVQLEYRPGTVVTFSRRLLRHGVIEEGGDQCCLAYYMRDNIHNCLGVPR
ncbi:hypothetical protein SCLCIDRAFT_54569, partial [Scleroderma citrinum Foug A]